MPGGVDSTGLAVGLKKGFLVEKRVMKVKPSQRRKEGKHVAFVRGIIREIAGYSPLERRGMELLKNGRDKRVLKLCKKRVREPTHAAQVGQGVRADLAAGGRAERRQTGPGTRRSSCTFSLWPCVSRACGGVHHLAVIAGQRWTTSSLHVCVGICWGRRGSIPIPFDSCSTYPECCDACTCRDLSVLTNLRVSLCSWGPTSGLSSAARSAKTFSAPPGVPLLRSKAPE